jgi:molybdopterin converting factor small subunit
MPIVEIPAALRGRAAGRAQITVEGVTVSEALHGLCRAHPELRPQLFTPAGVLKRTVGIFVGEDDVRTDEGLARALGPGERVVLVAAMAGG